MLRSGLEWKLSNYCSCLLLATPANLFDKKPPQLSVSCNSCSGFCCSYGIIIVRVHNGRTKSGWDKNNYFLICVLSGREAWGKLNKYLWWILKIFPEPLYPYSWMIIGRKSKSRWLFLRVNLYLALFVFLFHTLSWLECEKFPAWVLVKVYFRFGCLNSCWLCVWIYNFLCGRISQFRIQVLSICRNPPVRE